MRRTLALTATATLAFALVACGGDSDGDTGSGSRSGSSAPEADAGTYAEKAPAEIAADAREALTSLSAVHVSGTMRNGGDAVTMDLTLTDSGACSGTMAGPMNGGSDVEMTLLSDGEAQWVKFSEEFWASGGAQGAQLAEKVGDKWVTGDDMDAMFELCSIDDFTEGAFDPEDDRELSVEGTGEVDGEPVVELGYKNDADQDAVASVLAAEPHHVVRIAVPAAKGELTLDAFDEQPDIEAPAADEVVDIDELR